MASCKGMPAIAFIEFADMHGEIDLRTLPMGTLIITIGPTDTASYEDRQYMKCQHTWVSPDGGQWDDRSLAEDIDGQTRAGRRAIVHYAPIC